MWNRCQRGRRKPIKPAKQPARLHRRKIALLRDLIQPRPRVGQPFKLDFGDRPLRRNVGMQQREIMTKLAPGRRAIAWLMIKQPERSLETGTIVLSGTRMWKVVTYRCTGCGYLESFARDELQGE